MMQTARHDLINGGRGTSVAGEKRHRVSPAAGETSVPAPYLT